MLSHWPYSLLLFPALHLAWEDFRMREVSVLWLAVLGALSVAVGWGVSGLYPMLWRAVVNAGVLAALGFAMQLYQLCRRRPLRDFFSRDFGAGDAVMMAAVAPLFAPGVYVRFLLAASLSALVWWGVRRPATIPLAGFMALTLAVYVACKTAGLWN